MSSTISQIAAKLKLGYNIGNTLEAIGGETAWGNPMITQGLLDAVKAKGFDAVRIPCSWNQYADATTAKISDTWLNRVKTVLQYCMNANLYAVLNIHWDGGWLDDHINATDQGAVRAKQTAFWEQIATTMRDFDERLIFAGSNEPPASTAPEMDILYSYHQAFIDAVRSTGGRNAYRALVLQGPSTDTQKTKTLWSKMPTDTATNRLMVEVHYYSPYNFTIMSKDESWGKMFYYWGNGFHSTIEPDRNATYGEESAVDGDLSIIKPLFMDKGIPVILGEYGVTLRTTPLDMTMHKAARAYWLKYVTQQALANGMIPFLWDTGGLIDRNNYTMLNQQDFDALLIGAGKK
jgi:aryl-phospho-beta-D-glucosidase BglC (GH1 family)